MKKGTIVTVGTVDKNCVKGWTFVNGEIALDVKEQRVCGWTLQELKAISDGGAIPA